MSEPKAGVQSAIHNHMTKQCCKLLSTQAALKNGLDAICRKERYRAECSPQLIASKQIKPNNKSKVGLRNYAWTIFDRLEKILIAMSRFGAYRTFLKYEHGIKYACMRINYRQDYRYPAKRP
jgi:hypothetical protein